MVDELDARLSSLTIRDEHRLRRRLVTSRRGHRGPEGADAGAPSVLADLERAESLAQSRRASVPEVRYPADLPVSQRRDDLLRTIADHQVVIVAGETGSGKTTQLPKLCLELGRGVRGMIGHTQPRRIAARAVAERVAEELDGVVGDTVGFAVRFTDRVSESSLIKVMTDGILLAEIQRDRMLRDYDTIIIDEAHERSLNIDFLLGYLQQLLPRRRDLKLIITSATIDPERFAQYFDDAPVVEVSGRSYPVEIRYRPVVDPDKPATADRDQVTAICDAVTELSAERPGDVLIFLSGEREIRDTADALAGMGLRDTEILPLYARLSASEQHRVFARHRARRIVLATNVAETSLTVPGIKYVIDAGTARISRYSNRTKVQLLPIEPISQASARQRAGRCGRTSDGICLRLYSEADFDGRPQFTDPEILRTNLASVILQMATLDLGPIEEFGFIDAPDRRQIADGVTLLAELGALAAPGHQDRQDQAGPWRPPGRQGPTLTSLGRRIAQLPVDPRLARMIVEADRRGCVRDVLVLAAALSIQDPRERPAEHQQAADASHARFADPTSDFTGYLNLWRHVREQQRALSSSQFRRMCRMEFLNYLRIREWQDLFAQLRQIAKGMGIAVGDEPGDSDQIHRSLLAGLLSHIGVKEGPRGEYLGARNARFAVFPGSALFKKQPQFVMAAELVETSRLWARTCAAIEPEWAEELAGDIVRRSYSEPHWERRRGAAVAVERVTLYGVPLVVARKVGYHRIDPEHSRELFIRHALVEGDWQTRHRFFHANSELVAQVHDLENRARRRDLLIDDEALFAFYDSRIPATVVSTRHFDSWWKKAAKRDPGMLDLRREDLIRAGADVVSSGQFPDRWTSGSFDLDLSYRFEPGSDADGITVAVPLPLLNEAATAGLEWLVPGLREELVTALLRALPKPLRRSVVPVPDTAAALVATLPHELTGGATALTRLLSERLQAMRGVDIPADEWRWDQLPEHLRPTYRVVNETGAVLAESKDLPALRGKYAAQIATTLHRATADVSRDVVTDWDFGTLPRSVERTIAGHQVTGYPALVERSGDPAMVGIEVLASAADQRRAMWGGSRRLLLATVPSPVKQVKAALDPRTRLLMGRSPHGSIDALLSDCAAAAIDLLMRRLGAPVWDQEAFEDLRRAVSAELLPTTQRVVNAVASIIAETQQTELVLASPVPPSVTHVVVDERSHLAGLIFTGFVTATDSTRLAHLPRYLQAIRQRLADAPSNPGRDADRRAQVALVERDLEDLRRRLGADADPERLDAIRWLIEEFRVSLFAQRLGTSQPVSVKRIHTAMDELDPS